MNTKTTIYLDRIVDNGIIPAIRAEIDGFDKGNSNRTQVIRNIEELISAYHYYFANTIKVDSIEIKDPEPNENIGNINDFGPYHGGDVLFGDVNAFFDGQTRSNYQSILSAKINRNNDIGGNT